MSSPTRAATLNDTLAVALGATPVSDVTLFSPAGTVLYDLENATIGNKELGQRTAIKTTERGGAVSSIVGTDLTVMLPVQRFGTLGAVMLTMPKAPIDAAGRPWTAAGLIMALAILPALFLLWWVGRMAAAAGRDLSFRPQPIPAQMPAVPLRSRVHELSRPAVAAPAQHGLKEASDARRMAEDRAKAAEERLSVLQEQYRKTLDELHALKDRASAPVAADPALESRALQAEGRLRLIEGQLQAVTEERDKFEDELRRTPPPAAGEPNPQDEAARQHLESELIGVRAELEGTQTELAAARRQLAETSSNVSTAASATEEHAQRIRELEQDLDAAHVSILATQESLETARSEADQVRGQADEIRTQAAKVQSDHAGLVEARDRAVSERDAAILSSREESEALHRELEAANAMAGEESEAVRAQADLARSLKAELEQEQTEVKTARDALAAQTERIRELQRQLEGVRSEADENRTNAAGLQSDHAALREARDRAVSERDAAILSSREESEALHRELEAATAMAGEGSEAVRAYADVAAALKAELDQERSEAKTARDALAAQTERIRELQQQVEGTRSETLAAQETSSLAAAQAETARGELEATRKEIRALRNEEQRAAMLEDELRAARAELENMQASHRAEQAEREADLESRVRRTREDFQEEMAATSTQFAASQAELESSRIELIGLREEVASATESLEGQAARSADLADRTERAERELHSQQAAARKTASDLQEAVEANAELARKLQDLENRRQLELADEEGQIEMDQILYATQERLAGQTERLIEMEERAHQAERSAEMLNERLDETLSQLRSLQMSDALRDLRSEEHGQQDPAETASMNAATTEDVVRLEDRRASSPFLKELTLDAKKSLTQILGITQILKYKKDAKDQAQLVKQLTAYARRLDLTVSDLADADKLARGNIELTVRRTDLEALVQRVVEESGVSADHDLRVITEPLVCGVDQLRTEQVLAGMLRTSGDRTPQGKSILVTLQHVDGGALICVGDPEAASDASLSPVVRRFAEIQGGWAKVDTREDGTGSLFRVFLPDGGIGSPGADTAASSSGPELRIVVDESTGTESADGPWDDEEDQDLLVREIGRLADPG
ncbi:MAG: hypothetical protein ABI828_00620 [Actinomycetota bacterium]